MSRPLLGCLIALNAFFYFTHGVLLPTLPHLNEESAGLAFTALSVCKLLFFPVSGWISDRIGHVRGVTLALGLQVLGLAIIVVFPERAWVGRTIEGLALAQGTVSAISVFRLLGSGFDDFSTSISRYFGIGSIGFILGPIAGYLLLPLGARAPLFALAGVGTAFLIAQLVLQRIAFRTYVSRRTAGVPARESGGVTAAAPSGWLVAGLAGVRAMVAGWSPVLVFWATRRIGLAPFTAGLSFVLLGACFAFGSLYPRRSTIGLGFVGYALLEGALAAEPTLFWPALILLGVWYGSTSTLFYGILGWNRPENLGRYNSGWLLLSEIPMALTPVILWPWREGVLHPARLALGALLLLVTFTGMWRGVPSHASR